MTFVGHRWDTFPQMAIIEARKQRDGTVKYRARVRVTGHSHQSKTFTRKSDARDWARQVEVDLQRGRHLPTKEAARRTVAEMIDRYVTVTLPAKPRNRDAKKAKALLDWWRQRIGMVSLFAITPKLISECRDELLSQQTRLKALRSPATVNRSLAALSACFRAAIREWHWLDASPMPAVSRGAESAGIVRWLSDDERARLLDACRERAASFPWLFPLVLMALATGARRGELLGLKWRDVDLDRGMVVFHITKNGERRAVPIAGVAIEALRAWASGSGQARDLAGELVFAGPDPARPVYIEQAWREVLTSAQITEFRFHDLRHSAASYLAMSGATAPEIAAVLGHKTLQMVKRYAHLGEQHTAGVLSRMTDKFLKG